MHHAHRYKRRRINRGDSYMELTDILLKTEGEAAINDREQLSEPLDREFMADIK